MKGHRIITFVIAVGLVVVTSSKELTIAAFNVRIFGQQKVANQEVVDVLIKIISRYDLVLIQEIRDKSETAIEELLKQVNDVNNNAYSHVISARLGRSSSKEQYSFFYKNAIFTPVETYLYIDPGDKFEREPFNVRFKVNGWALPDLVLSGIHTKPDDAVTELSQMVDVYEDLVGQWGVKDILMMGDFNADCTYVRQSEWSEVRLRTDKRFVWHIDDEADTTVRVSTDCAYDRFVIAGQDLQNAVVSSKVFDFEAEYKISKELAEGVSDHFPIQVILSDKAFSPITPPIDFTTDAGRDTSNIHVILTALYAILVVFVCCIMYI